MEWPDEAVLTARIASMDGAQRHQAAYLALRRLQAPLLGIPMPPEWGVDPAAVLGVLDAGAARLDGEADDRLHRAVAALSRAPLFESEVDPELAESFQLEAIGGWLQLEEALGEMSAARTDEIITLARRQADYLDGCIDATLMVVAGEEARERYLAAVEDPRLRAHELGYFATRNLEVEARCHAAVLAGSPREPLHLCDEYSHEMLTALKAFPTDRTGSQRPYGYPC
jgi:hypothetical protein